MQVQTMSVVIIVISMAVNLTIMSQNILHLTCTCKELAGIHLWMVELLAFEYKFCTVYVHVVDRIHPLMNKD